MEHGKTTTIKLLLGLHKMDKGEVFINGYSIKKNFEKAVEKVGAIIENPEAYRYLSGYKNLKLVSNMYKTDEKRIDDVVKLVGLENRIHDKVSKYSLGMKQRLGIASAILNNPNVLILDEPTNGLDPEGIKELRNILIKLAKEEKMGILVSSHNLSELENFCTRVCIIQNGKIVEESEMENFKSTENIPRYIIEVSTTSGLEDIFEKDYEIIENNKIRISSVKENIPKVIEKLKNNNIDVYEVKREEISLEDAFLKRTGGNKIV